MKTCFMCKVSIICLLVSALCWALTGCGAVYDICVENKKYGKVCVTIDGHKYVRRDLTPSQIEEAESEAKQSPSPSPSPSR
jgi:hypothetical protein